MSEKPHILIVDDERAVLVTLGGLLERHGFKVTPSATGSAARHALQQSPPDLVLLDLGLPDADGLELLKEFRALQPAVPVIVLSGQDSLSNAIDSIKLGAFHFIGKPYVPEELLSLLRRALDWRNLERETVSLREQTVTLTARLQEAEQLLAPVFKSRKMAAIEQLVEKIARSEANILVTGESGVGKEVLANLIHEKSLRAAGPLVKLNCAAFPQQMIEGELFGYVKGAFTGASQDFPGMIDAAKGGTLFLDEIAEMAIELQTRFLRVLQEREFRQLGSTRTQKADFRLIAATNRDVKEAVREGRLRQDLYYRLNTFQIEIPPLRERKEEVPALAGRFAARFAAEEGRAEPKITPAAMQALSSHLWPGNVRELENAMEYAVVLAAGTPIELEHLPQDVRSADSSLSADNLRNGGGLRFADDLNLDKIEQAALEEALRRSGGNKKEASRLLGLHRATFYNKLKRFGIGTIDP